jgi:hypothetical protein
LLVLHGTFGSVFEVTSGLVFFSATLAASAGESVLNIQISGSGADGVVVVTGKAKLGIKNCTAITPANCSGGYEPGAKVTLKAVPSAKFHVWGPGSGPCTGKTRPTCTVRLPGTPPVFQPIFDG